MAKTSMVSKHGIMSLPLVYADDVIEAAQAAGMTMTDRAAIKWMREHETMIRSEAADAALNYIRNTLTAERLTHSIK